MRYDEPPSEETLRELIDEARGRGEETITVEATREAGDAWVRAGFTEQARVLEASVASLEQRLASDKAPSYGSVHVQTDDLDGVVRAVRQFVPRMPGGSKGSVVAPPRNGWIGVYDELTDRNPEMLRRLAREISDRMGAVVLLLGVEEGQVVRFVLLERGRTMDEYLSVPEYYGEVPPGDVISLAANPTVVARLTGAILPRCGASSSPGRARTSFRPPMSWPGGGLAAGGRGRRPRVRARRGDPRRGRRPTRVSVLLLLHAFPLDARMWEGQVPVLEQAGYEVIAPNLPGAEPDASIASWAGRILELLPGDFIPVGISMGGYLAFELWRQAPKRIPALVLADTRANADDEAGRAAREETIRLLREEGFDAFWEGLAPKLFSAGASAEVVEGARAIASEQPTESLVATVEALRDRLDSTSTLADIDVPALVLVGEEDALTPPLAAKEIVAGLTEGRYAEIPGAGHLSPLERPAEFNEEILLFLHEVLA